MSSLPISDKPSKFNWADDDKDDWDFETYCATTKISAPTLDSLPPLQLSPAQDDTSYGIYSSATTTEEAKEAVTEDTTPTQNESSDFYPGNGNATVAWRHINDRDDARLAYTYMSYYDDGSPSPFKRERYSFHWKGTKAALGWDGRKTALLWPSKLAQVETIESDITTTQDAQDAQSPVEEPTHAEDEDVDVPRNDSCIDSDMLDLLEPVCTGDEGYYTDSSRSTSPASPKTEEKLRASYCATKVGISPALPLFALRCIPAQQAVEKEEDELDGIDYILTFPTLTEKPAQGIDIVDEKSDFSAPSSQATALSWLCAANTSLITTAFMATGILAGAGMYLARRRG